MLCSFWLSTIFLFMVIVAKSVIQIVDSVGVFLSALGLHNYNRLLALHLQKKYWFFFIFHYKMPLKFNLKAPILQIFLGGHAPRPPSISMLIVVLCTIYSTSNFTLYKGPHLYFKPQAPNFSWRPCSGVYNYNWQSYNHFH